MSSVDFSHPQHCECEYCENALYEDVSLDSNDPLEWIDTVWQALYRKEHKEQRCLSDEQLIARELAMREEEDLEHGCPNHYDAPDDECLACYYEMQGTPVLVNNP